MVRSLTSDERALILLVLNAVPKTEPLQKQLDATVVVDEHIPTALSLRVEEEKERSEMSDGPLPGNYVVETPNGEPTGIFLLWIKNGQLSMMEHAWFTDEPPTGMPSPRSVVVQDKPVR